MTPSGNENVDVLMYHSISGGSGPTCTHPETFRRQMDALVDCGYRVISLSHLAAWHRGQLELTGPSVVLTFDDGFLDFATEAFPELHSRGWPATVFIPAGKLGGSDDWESACRDSPPRKLMDWNHVESLSAQGIEFGAHGVSHADLTRLPLPAAREEITLAKRMIEDRLGRAVSSFAPPYGKTNKQIDAQIRTTYEVSVGTRLFRARRTADIHDLPRIEMYYFRSVRRWRAYLEGNATAYVALRRSLRRIRQLASIRVQPTIE